MTDSPTPQPPAASQAASLRQTIQESVPVSLLALTLFLLPAAGVPSELMVQDTLKSFMAALGVLVSALLFFWQLRGRTTKLQWHGLVVLPLVLMAYALGSMAWSHAYLAGVEAIRWLLFGLLVWLGMNSVTPKNVSLLLWGIHWGAVVASVWAVLQFLFDFGLFPQGPSPASTFINRNFYAEYLVCALPFSALALANMRHSRRSWLMAITVAINIVGLMMTGTRAALVTSIAVGLGALFIGARYRSTLALHQWNRRQAATVMLALVATVAGLGAIPSTNPKVLAEAQGSTALQRSILRTASVARSEEYTAGSFAIRAVMWRATARMMIAHGATGVGAGAWEVKIPLFQPADMVLETDFYAHNEYLQLLSEYGLVVGGLVLAVLLAYLMLSAAKTWRLPADQPEAPLRATALTSLLGLLLVSNAGFPWHLAATSTLFAICLSLLAGSDARLNMHDIFFAKSLHWRRTFTWSTGICLLVGCALAIGITIQAARAEYKIVRAIKLAYALNHPSQPAAVTAAEAKAEMLQDLREGIAIAPHYRKLTPIAADLLASAGDWKNAVWVWESVAASRPHIAAIWSNLTKGYSRLGEPHKAMEALQHWKALSPEATDAQALEIVLWNRLGQTERAIEMFHTTLAQNGDALDVLQAGFTLGTESQHWELAVQSLEAIVRGWPSFAPDGYLKLGNIYATSPLRDDRKALAAYRSSLGHAVDANQHQRLLQAIPAAYAARLGETAIN